MVELGLAAVAIAVTVFVMNDGGRFHRRRLLAAARRHLALVLRGRGRDSGLDDQVVAAAISAHCLAISEPKSVRGLEAGYRLCTARWSLSDLPSRRRAPAASRNRPRYAASTPRDPPRRAAGHRHRLDDRAVQADLTTPS
ncbi:hypothetical protein [Streptomyces griseofuscus]|uniref:hypothetical protein n=1 Tax=Streptomyces griseofuscus TaxID=146922 RepID=UPI00368DC439